MNILYCHADTQTEWNCSEWRCVIPALAINTLEGHEARLVSLEDYGMMTQEGVSQANWADVIVIQRNLSGIVLSTNEYWKANGKTIVLDIDDDYQHMPPTIRTYSYWILGEIKRKDGSKGIMQYKPYEQLKWGMKLVHGVTTPSDVIAHDWANFNSNIFVLPNYINFPIYEGLYREIDRPINIGWAGSVSHGLSFKESGILTAINRILYNYKDINFVVIGGTDIFPMIKTDMTRKKWIPWVPFHEWPRTLSQNIDIGIAVLSGRYDQRRSWIKVLEYMAEGIPCVATNYQMYEPFADCVTLVRNKPNDWEKALSNMIENFSVEKEKAKQNIDQARTLDARANAAQIISVYKEIVERTKK